MIPGRIALLWVLAAAPANAQQAPGDSTGIRAQMGVRVSPDTVTIGDPFTLRVRVKVQPGLTVEFPQMPDSTDGPPPVIAQARAPEIERAPDDSLEFRAAYTLTAWDVGAQLIPLADVRVTGHGETGFLPLRAGVFVKSVLPADSAQRTPRPLRDRFPVKTTNWWPLLFFAAAVALGELLWAVYRWYRRRRSAPRDPYEVALQEFKRVESLQLAEKGEPERHAVLMAEAMRAYLAAKIPGAHVSDTFHELVGRMENAKLADARVREITEKAELLKFARGRATPPAALELGRNARAAVEMLEARLNPKSTNGARAA